MFDSIGHWTSDEMDDFYFIECHLFFWLLIVLLVGFELFFMGFPDPTPKPSLGPPALSSC